MPALSVGWRRPWRPTYLAWRRNGGFGSGGGVGGGGCGDGGGGSDGGRGGGGGMRWQALLPSAGPPSADEYKSGA